MLHIANRPGLQSKKNLMQSLRSALPSDGFTNQQTNIQLSQLKNCMFDNCLMTPNYIVVAFSNIIDLIIYIGI